MISHAGERTLSVPWSSSIRRMASERHMIAFVQSRCKHMKRIKFQKMRCAILTKGFDKAIMKQNLIVL